MAIPPHDFSEWIAAPAPFHGTKKGERAELSDGNCVVKRKGAEIIDSHCVCFTANPLPVGQLWKVEVLCTDVRRWKSELVSEHQSTLHGQC